MNTGLAAPRWGHGAARLRFPSDDRPGGNARYRYPLETVTTGARACGSNSP